MPSASENMPAFRAGRTGAAARGAQSLSAQAPYSALRCWRAQQSTDSHPPTSRTHCRRPSTPPSRTAKRSITPAITRTENEPKRPSAAGSPSRQFSCHCLVIRSLTELYSSPREIDAWQARLTQMPAVDWSNLSRARNIPPHKRRNDCIMTTSDNIEGAVG